HVFVNKFLTAGDLIIILLILIAGLVSLYYPRQNGSIVYIKVNGEIKGVYNLNNKNKQTITIAGKKGTMKVEIQEGRVWVSESSCPNKLCIKMGKIHKNGEMIVCVPNRVIISVKNKEEKEVDAITM
ncbi:hypothetical protein DRQ07_06170, partial [candidate division KSB1 bacterium]